MYLQRIIQKLEQFIQEGNPENLGADDVKNFVEYELILMLQKAILAGEYYVEKEYGECDKKINKIIDFLSKISIEVNEYKLIAGIQGEIEAIDWKSQIDERSFSKKVGIISGSYLNPYLDLIRTVDKNLNNLAKGQQGNTVDLKILQGFSILNDFLQLAEKVGVESDNNNIRYIYSHYIFQITLLLTYIDEFMECKLSTIETLDNIIHFLSKVKSNNFTIDVIPILTAKAEFLKYKINFRFCHQNHEGERLGLEFEKLNYDHIFKQFGDKIELHYSEHGESDIRRWEKEVEAFKTTPIQELRLEPFHHLSRYYNKKSTKSLAFRKKKIEDLIDILNSKNDTINQLTLYNRIAFNSCLKLLSNSLLSVFLNIERENRFDGIISDFKDYLEGNKATISSPKLEKIIEDAYALVEKGGYPDYYCIWLLVRWFSDLIEFITKDPGLLIDKSVMKDDEINKETLQNRILSLKSKLENQYNNVWEQLSSLFQQMTTHESKPIYLYSEECKINYKFEGNGEQIPLFLDSSYILPNDFKRIRRKIDNSKAFLGSQLNHLKDALGLEMNQIVIENTVVKAEKKAKENEFRAVQIVALFVSIATFVLINVKIFDGKTGLQSFAIMLGIASCLFMFNLFFHFMILTRNRGEKSFKSMFSEIGWLLVSPILFASLSWFLLSKEDKNLSLANDRRNREIIDSIIRTDMKFGPKEMKNDTLSALDSTSKK